MPSQVQIANMALQAVGTRSTIASLSESSKEAINVAQAWEQVRDELLGRAWWNMARKTQVLTMLKTGPGTPEFSGTYTGVWLPTYPAPPWSYTYAIPSDFISPRYIVPIFNVAYPGVPLFSSQSFVAGYAMNGVAIKFVSGLDVDAEGNQIRVILTNQSSAMLVYTARVENPDLWDKDFVSAFVSLLAAWLAQPLTGSRTLRTELLEIAEAKIRMAATSDANEGLTVQETIPESLRVRGYGTDGLLPPIDSVS